MSVKIPFQVFDDRTEYETIKSIKTINPRLSLYTSPCQNGLQILDEVIHSNMDYEIVADIGSLKGLSQKGKQSVLDTFTHEYTEWFRENGYADVNITIKYTDGIDYEYNRRKDKGLY